MEMKVDRKAGVNGVRGNVFPVARPVGPFGVRGNVFPVALWLCCACVATASVPTAEVLGRASEHGARVEAIENGWRFTETSEGTTGNAGATLVFTYGPESEEVAAINAVLAASEDSSAVDFAVDASIQRATAPSRPVSTDFTVQWEGGRRPQYPLQPYPAQLHHNAFYQDGMEHPLSALTPRATFRVWPTGGKASIERLVLRFGVRVDTDSTPETMDIRNLVLVQNKLDAKPKGKVALCLAGLPPQAFLNVWAKHGIHARVGLEPAEGEEVAVVYVDTLHPRDDEAKRIAGYLEKGVIGYFSTGADGGSFHAVLASYMPVNDWPFKPHLVRGALRDVSRHFDMHLPGSVSESPMLRYDPVKYLCPGGKPSADCLRRGVPVDWKREPDGLPLVVDADFRETRVVFFSASYEDPILMDHPKRSTALAEIPFGPKANSPRFVDKYPLVQARLEAFKPFDIAIEEDEATISELHDESPEPREGVDGIISYRYIYRPGTKPSVTLRLRNHCNNIAVGAIPIDLVWSENPSVRGLNDMAFTHASIRGKLPLHAVWCGRPAESQKVALQWQGEATIAGIRLTGGGSYRNWSRSNPRDFALFADKTEVFRETNVDFTPTAVDSRAIYERMFQPVRATELSLDIEHLDPKANREPRRDGPANCSLTEWEVWGWICPETPKPQTVSLEMTVEDLETGRTTTRTLAENVTIPGVAEHLLRTELPAKNSFGPVRYHFTMLDDTKKKVLAKRDFDVLFVPAERTKLTKKIADGCIEGGLLCTPGWRQADSFGLGMNKWTEGWGGPHDKLWALEQDLLEMGPRAHDDPAKMFTSATRATHYTNPWRRFQNGVYTWDWIAEHFLADMESGRGRWKDKTSLHVVGSDRWNGVNIWTCFGWDVFVDFDLWLRGQGKPGLKARSREAIEREISEEHGDEWQVFNLRRYADHMLQTQQRFADHGIPFAFETHGSFPLCGGELGADLAKTHVGVGMDAFWDLQKQDLWGTIGMRIGMVAANPDLRSGAYDEWGWTNSEQNQWWFASNGDLESARRQWYAMYFLGRVRLDGTFRPYHEMGFGSQGNHGVRYTAFDHQIRCRVHELVTQLRPEEVEGYGIVVSWRGQERRMGKKLGRMGFGLYPADGEDDVIDLCQSTYAPLVKAGLPITFVTSTDALKNWKGKAPLLLVDAPNWEDWELEAAQAAMKRGCQVVALGTPHKTLANPKAENLLQGALFWREHPSKLTAPAAAALVRDIKPSLRVSPGVVAVPFRSQGHLFVALCNQSDDATVAHVEMDPMPKRAVVLDEGRAIEGKLDVPLPPAGARVVMVCD